MYLDSNPISNASKSLATSFFLIVSSHMCIALLFLCLITQSSRADDTKLLVFDALRLEMSVNPEVGENKYFTPSAKSKWASKPYTLLSSEDRKYIFSYAIRRIISVSENKTIVAYFNPWVGAVIYTLWTEVNGKWSVNDIAIESSEILFGEQVSEKNLSPPWLRVQGEMIEGMEGYFNNANAKIVSGAKKAFGNSAQVCAEDCIVSLSSVAARLVARKTYIAKLLSPEGTKDKIEKALLSVRKVFVSRNEQQISDLFKKNGKLFSKTISQLPDFIGSTLVTTWFLRDGDKLMAFMASHVTPNLFFCVWFADDGTIEGIMPGNWARTASSERTKGQ